MNGKKVYAFKTIQPVLWQGIFYWMFTLLACALTIGSDSWWDKGLTVVLLAGSIAYTWIEGHKYLHTYYVLQNDGVCFMQAGKQRVYPFAEVESAQYDASHAGIALTMRNGRSTRYDGYTNLSPLVQALDAHGIRIEYQKMQGR